MVTALPESGPGWLHSPGPGVALGALPWSVRLAGAQSACPALEVYEAGVLLDVVSSTRLAGKLLRGGRAAVGDRGPAALAWGRVPAQGAELEVQFSRPGFRSGWLRTRRVGWGRPGRLSPAEPAADVQAASTLRVTSWCWLATADGRFSRVSVRSGDHCLRLRLSGGR